MGKNDSKRDIGAGSDEKKHKRHNSKSAKLKRKHEMKKNRRRYKEQRSKKKAMKKERDRIRRLKLASEAFTNKVTPEDIDIVRKVIAKLIDHSHNSIKELPELFEMLD